MRLGKNSDLKFTYQTNDVRKLAKCNTNNNIWACKKANNPVPSCHKVVYNYWQCIEACGCAKLFIYLNL